jgi:hypothetical protein
MAENESLKGNPPSVYLAFIVGIGGFLITIILRSCGLIPDWSVVFLIGFFILAAIAVHAFPRLEEINLRQFSIRLRKVEEVEKRIYAKEQTVRELMVVLADIAVMDSLNAGRLGPWGELAVVLAKWREKRVEKILDLAEATPDEKTKLRRFVPIYKGIDEAHKLNVPAPQREEAADPYWKQLIAQLRSEIS